MLKVKKSYRNETIFFVLMALVCFMIFCFGKKKVLAAGAENGKVNLEAWSLTDTKKSDGTEATDNNEVVEATLVYNSSVESGFKDIVIPNATDFKSTYPVLQKVWIGCSTMQSVASNANKTGGSLKISDTGKDGNNIADDAKKIFAKGENWYFVFGQKDKIQSNRFDWIRYK